MRVLAVRLINPVPSIFYGFSEVPDYDSEHSLPGDKYLTDCACVCVWERKKKHVII